MFALELTRVVVSCYNRYIEQIEAANEGTNIMAVTVTLQLDSNVGYAADQITQRITLQTLLELTEAAIEMYGAEAEIITSDPDNRYGASYGRIRAFEHSNADEVFVKEIGLDDECETCGGYTGENKEDAADSGWNIGHDTECPENEENR